MKRNFLSILVAMSIVLLSLGGNYTFASDVSDESEQVLNELVCAVQEKDWDVYTSLVCSDKQEFYENYFTDESITTGIKQVEEVELMDMYEVPVDSVSDELLTRQNPILETSDTVSTYIVALNCDVNIENSFFFEGINYFLIALAEENGEMKLVQFNRPSADLLDDTVKKNISASDDFYEEKMAGINVIEEAQYAQVINAEAQSLTSGFESISIENVTINESDDDTSLDESIEGGVSTQASGATGYPILKTYSNYSYPTSIKVYRKDAGEIVTVKFATYLKNVLPNEVYASWDIEALKANAYCVKMVGWYHAISPESSDGGYNISTSTQTYVPDSAVTETNNAFSKISKKGMANSDKKIFFPDYRAGTKGDDPDDKGHKGKGILYQWGSQYLATEKDYTCNQILNYYYKGSASSSGSLVFFSYS